MSDINNPSSINYLPAELQQTKAAPPPTNFEPSTKSSLDPWITGAKGAVDAGTFGAAKYLAHLMGNDTFQQAQQSDPNAYKTGELVGNVGSAFVPGVGLAGKALEGIGGAVKGLGLLKDIGVGAQKLGNTGNILGTVGRGALEAGVNTEAHNLGNDANSESGDNQDVLGSMATGGVVGGGIGVLGKLASGVKNAAQGASDAATGFFGVGQPQWLNRVRNPASNNNPVDLANKINAVKERIAPVVKEGLSSGMTPTDFVTQLNDKIVQRFAPFDEAVKNDPKTFTNLLTKNWGGNLKDLANDSLASQAVSGGTTPVGVAAAPLYKQILSDVQSKIDGGGNLMDIRQMARDNTIGAFKSFASGSHDPLDGYKWKLWNNMGKSIDDSVDEMGALTNNESIRQVGQDYGDAQMLADGVAHQNAITKMGGQSATFGRGLITGALSGGKGVLPGIVAQFAGPFLERATQQAGARVANAASGPLNSASDFLSNPAVAGFLDKAGSPEVSQLGARMAPNLMGLGGQLPEQTVDQYQPQDTSGLFSQQFGPAKGPIPANLNINSPYGSPDLEDASNAALEKLGLGQFATHGGIGGPPEQPPVNHYQGMVVPPRGTGQNISTPSQPVNLAHVAISAQSGNQGAQEKLKMAVASGLASQLAQNGAWTILHGPPTLDNPAFQTYLSNALTRISDQNGNIQPDRAGEYIFTNDADREQYQRGISAFRTIEQNIKPAMGSTGLGGMINQATGGLFNGEALRARNNLYGALEGFSGAESQAGAEQNKASIDSILNNPITNEQYKTNAIYQLLGGKSPYTANVLLKKAGIDLGSMR